MRVLSIALLASVIAAAPQGMEGMGGMGGSKGGGGIPKSPKGAGGSPKGGGGGAPRSGSVSNDLLEGTCKDIFFIMARASTEPGNMYALLHSHNLLLTLFRGGTMGPIVCRGLRDIYKDRVGCQGVGGPYSAGLADNARPKGTTDGAINEAIKMFTTADTKCPKAILTFGGYRFVYSS
jgi:cutinase